MRSIQVRLICPGTRNASNNPKNTYQSCKNNAKELSIWTQSQTMQLYSRLIPMTPRWYWVNAQVFWVGSIMQKLSFITLCMDFALFLLSKPFPCTSLSLSWDEVQTRVWEFLVATWMPHWSEENEISFVRRNPRRAITLF